MPSFKFYAFGFPEPKIIIEFKETTIHILPPISILQNLWQFILHEVAQRLDRLVVSRFRLQKSGCKTYDVLHTDR